MSGMSNQEILDHTSRYLWDRIQNHNGKMVRGWYDGNSGDKCIVGALSPCRGIADISTDSFNRVTGGCSPFVPKLSDFPGICQQLIIGNDYLAKQGQLTKEKANQWITSLALYYHLDASVWRSLLNKSTEENREEETEKEDSHTHEEDTECALEIE